ncbi:MAG: hypothetical protein KC422_09020 [Trueperaceae bacterium]|nr:hypothetical protein [Trueperaceae bacterium]
MDFSELCYSSASDLRKRLLAKEISCLEVIQAHIARIEQVNEAVNAIVTFIPEQALEQAKRADEQLAKQDSVGLLHGLPVAHKDLAHTKGIRTTEGSPLFKDFVPEQDDLIIERIKAAGAITVGKTNTPEFGAGSQTFNEVFGATKNPYHLSKTCGGSSGGSAVALATGMVPLADGSDMGGSLRNPAAFCNVVGFRTTPGLVPDYPSSRGWNTFSVVGPMARTVEDSALFLAAIAGHDDRVPISRSDDSKQFLSSLETDLKAKRIAWALDFAGLPFDKRVTETLEPLAKTFTELGCTVEAAQPDFSEADYVFKTYRAYSFAASHHERLKTQRDKLKDTVIWNAEEGLKLTALDLAKAEEARTRLFVRVAEFMKSYDYLILPVTQVPPFDVTQPYVKEIAGVQMETYIDWMKSCYYISTIGNPAISVPGGFTAEGLPIGLQIVGRYGHDLEVLQLAHAFEQATKVGQKRPSLS